MYVVLAEPPTSAKPYVRTTASPSYGDDLFDQIVHPEQEPDLPNPSKLGVLFLSVISSILSLLLSPPSLCSWARLYIQWKCLYT